MYPLCSYLICATPRSGSTLLCEALINTGLAGRPEEYFESLKESGRPRRPLEYFTGVENAELIGLLGGSDGPPPAYTADTHYGEYLARTIEQATTPNGVFGAKVMWGYLDDFVSNLLTIPQYNDLSVPELMVEDRRETRIPPLRHPRGHAGAVRFLVVVVDVEMLRLEDLELERLILDLVLTEVLRADRRGQRQQQRPQEKQDPPRIHRLLRRIGRGGCIRRSRYVV